MDEIITIDLLGEPFKFRAEESNTVDPKDIAGFLTNAVKQVEERFPEYGRKTNKLAIMVLAALNITRDYFELRENHSGLLQTVSSRTAHLDRMIDAAVLRYSADADGAE